MDRWQRCGDCVCAVVQRNPATAKLIGLCPMLAVSNTMLKAVALGVLLGAVAIICAFVVSLLRHCVSWRLKPVYHALIASFTTAGVVAGASIEYDALIATLGLYPALIASNCLVLSIIQEVAERNPLKRTIAQGLHDAFFVIAFLGLFGAVRELGAYGSITVDGLLVNTANSLDAVLPNGPIPLLATAPGALLVLALILAGVNAITRRNYDPGIDPPVSDKVDLPGRANVGSAHVT